MILKIFQYNKRTIPGKIIGGLTAIFGVILIALPVGLISGKYSYYHERNKKIKQVKNNQNVNSKL